jgi:hypothetical protein
MRDFVAVWGRTDFPLCLNTSHWKCGRQMQWIVVGGLRLRAIMDAAVSRLFQAPAFALCNSHCTRTVFSLFVFLCQQYCASCKNSFLETRCEFCGEPESSYAPWLSLSQRKLVDMRTCFFEALFPIGWGGGGMTSHAFTTRLVAKRRAVKPQVSTQRLAKRCTLIRFDVYNAVTWTSPTCFDPSLGPSSGTFLITNYTLQTNNITNILKVQNV